MTENSVQCWLVERSYSDENLVSFVYATPDGSRYHQRDLSANMLFRLDVTAARSVPESDLQPVDDEALRERYATEADRMASEHAPDDVL